MAVTLATSPNRRRRRITSVADVVLLLIAAGCTWYALGLGALLFVVGVGLLLDELERRPGELLSVAAIPGAVITETMILFVAAIATARLLPSTSFDVTAPVILGAPIVAVLVVKAVRRIRAGGRHGRIGKSVQFRFAAAAVTIFAVGDAAVEARGRYFDVAWVMSNDSANHMYITRAIISHDGLTAEELHHYPPVANLLAALFSAAPGRTGLDPSQLLHHDLQAFASTYVVLFAAIFLSLAACVVVAVRASRGAVQQARLGTYLLMILSGATVVTPLIMVEALHGGFLSAVAGILFSVAALATAMQAVERRSPVALALAASGTLLAFFSWVLVGIALCPIVLIAAYEVWRDVRSRTDGTRPALWARVGLAVGVVVPVGILIGAIVSYRQLAAGLAGPGGAYSVRSGLLAALTVCGVVGALACARRPEWRLWLVPTAAGISTGLLVVLLRLSPVHGGMSAYYQSKFIWVEVASLSWVPFALAGVLLLRATRSRTLRIGLTAGAVACAVAILGAYEVAIPQSAVRQPLAWIWNGGDVPDQATLAQMFRLAQTGHAVVLWRSSDSPAEQQLLNFWSAQIFSGISTTAASRVPLASVDSGYLVSPAALAFRNWAADAYNSRVPITTLCQFLATRSSAVVVTSTAVSRGRLPRRAQIRQLAWSHIRLRPNGAGARRVWVGLGTGQRLS